MQNFKHRNDCRLCGSRSLELVLPILPSPIGDAFVPVSKLSEKQELFPLDTYLCNDCGHLQNLDVVNPDILFREYTYRTSVSLGLVDHFRNYAASIVKKLELSENSLVVEMGSNDGSLLKEFRAHGFRILGIDPARVIADEATKQGIVTIPDYFSLTIAENIKENYGEASLFCANNVFAHVDNLSGIVSGISHLLSPNGVFVFEVSYVPDMIKNMVFDVIYHEHVSHHALLPLERFFNNYGMTLFDVEFIPTKGGSMRGYAQLLASGSRSKSSNLLSALANERDNGILTSGFYKNFYKEIQDRKSKLINYVKKAENEGRVIAAYGASTTTTTLLYHFELQDHVKFIFDDNKLKQGLYSPGAHIPVCCPEDFVTKQPNIIIILAWTYADKIISKNKKYLESGVEFIIPLPDFKIVNSGSDYS